MMRAAVPALLLFSFVACSSASSAPAEPVGSPEAGVDASAEAGEPPLVSLVASFDLPRQLTTQGLSAASFDEATRTLFTLQDHAPSIVPLAPSEDWKTWTVGMPIAVTGTPAGDTYDAEGLVHVAGGFYAITSETTPTLAKLDAQGKVLSTITLPAHYAAQSAGNKGLESLSLSPSGRFLFTVNEGALVQDDTLSSKTKGTTVRILRHELATSSEREIAYRTEKLGAGTTTGDLGVSDVAALSDDVLLVLERGFQSGYGNTVRIFRVDLAGAPDVLAVHSVGPTAAVVPKTLVVDLAALPSEGITHPATQPNPILDNYEALALGPLLPDGRRLLIVVSDDNASEEQVARVLVLAVRP
jgi:hypothetical protein